jgi:predicted DNA-binding transcriptional regulator AlpA
MSTAHISPPAIEPELLTSGQAAQLCGLSKRTLWRHAGSGVLPRPVKIGLGPRAMTRWRRSDLLAWIERGCPTERKQGGVA